MRKSRSRRLRVVVFGTITELLRSSDRPLILCIDAPIGLLDGAVRGGRVCDRESRKLLGWPRRNSVFSAPVRPALRAKSYEQALRINRRSSRHGIGISRQSYGILPKIREMDELMTARRQKTIVEVHPELVFYELNGGKAIQESKKSEVGRGKRVDLLAQAFRVDIGALVEEHRSSKVARDDIVDAISACWTAARVVKGREIRLVAPERDSKGLRMEIVR